MTTIGKIPLCDLLLVCACAIGGAIFWSHKHAAAADAAAVIAREQTKSAIADADKVRAFADSAKAIAFTYEVQRDSARATAATFASSASRLTGKLAGMALSAPDTCRPIIITADSALAAKDSVISELNLAIDRSITLDTVTMVANDSLRASLARLSTASTTLVKADEKLSRAQKLKALLPSFGFGESFGVDRAGQPHLVTGITLGWHF